MDELNENEEEQIMKPEDCLKWILWVSVSPIAILVLILMALFNLLRFLFKASLLFIIVVINTPFAVMYNVSLVVFEYNLGYFWNSNVAHRNWSDPRASVGIEVKLLVSDFFKVVSGELLVVMSGGIITFYTAPRLVFYISTAISVVAVFHKWLHTDCLSKTALSCLSGGYGLGPMMFLFSFIGFFDIGGHPIAKCSFVARRAFLFVKDEEDGRTPYPKGNPRTRILEQSKGPKKIDPKFYEKVGQYRFKTDTTNSKNMGIKFFNLNAFERGLFQLSPRIDFKIRKGKHILESFMVLRLLHKVNLCEYPVERVELPEDYSKVNELFNFLDTLSKNDGFVTDKMRGRYEHSLTLLQIVEGVAENARYNIVDSMEEVFIVAGCSDLQQ